MNSPIVDPHATPLEWVGSLVVRAFDTLFPWREPLVRQISVVTLPPPPPPTKPEPPDGFLIGTDRKTKEPIYALSSELDRHVLIVGGTGCGKSTLIARLFTEEIQKWQ